jgi:hypothetical protein
MTAGYVQLAPAASGFTSPAPKVFAGPRFVTVVDFPDDAAGDVGGQPGPVRAEHLHRQVCVPGAAPGFTRRQVLRTLPS